jgi:hypothetical protein
MAPALPDQRERPHRSHGWHLSPLRQHADRAVLVLRALISLTK